MKKPDTKKSKINRVVDQNKRVVRVTRPVLEKTRILETKRLGIINK